jgi:hypothetical protein
VTIVGRLPEPAPGRQDLRQPAAAGADTGSTRLRVWPVSPGSDTKNTGQSAGLAFPPSQPGHEKAACAGHVRLAGNSASDGRSITRLAGPPLTPLTSGLAR